jgi:hypothetical protein
LSWWNVWRGEFPGPTTPKENYVAVFKVILSHSWTNVLLYDKIPLIRP